MLSSSLNLRLKFIFGLVLFALALGICISIILYFHFNSIMESEIRQRSRMVLAQSNAVQDYVKTVLRPEMFDTLPQGRFVLKAMSSSYISREIMTRLNARDDLTYHYRRVSKKPRNPDSAPDALESRLISIFARDRSLSIWEDEAMVGNTEYHIVARPVVFTDSCMNCHGDPGAAPEELIEIYGNENGFHYSPGEVGGVVVAGFPVDMIKNPAKEVTLQYLMFYLFGILIFALLISLFFDRLVMKNLQNLSTIFKTRFSGEQEQGIIRRLGEKDEIEGLIEGVDELALCLSNARNELEDYTQNLEIMVDHRTREIKEKAEKHRADVRLFVEILSRFGGFSTAGQIISGALECIGERFSARQVIYHCTVASENSYAWHDHGPIQGLGDEVKEILWNDEALSVDHTIHVPVKSKESHWGILSISWPTVSQRGEADASMLLALGQQLAILIENVMAFSNVRFQNDMLQSVFEGISDPLLLIDENYRILMANTGSREIFSKKRKQDREKELKEFLKDRDTGEKNILEQMLEKQEPVSREIGTAQGKSFRVDLYPLPTREQAGLKIVLYAREITLEKQMMSRMQQAERLSAIGKMAAGVAHEINNPLGVISCYTDLVKDAVSEPSALEDIGMIEKHTKNVQKIVQELLKLSRPKQAVSGKCTINKVVFDAVKVFQTQAASKGIRVDSRLKKGLPRIKCDPGILEQILTNLWLNAFDALQETGGQVWIETGLSKNKKEVVLSIRDNGPGIPGSVLGNIFDPFFTTKKVGKGTGLGLAVVYGFVNEMGGRIEVFSDGETCFEIYFPLERS
ncbi:c-type heme family protein [Desulfospira joergensenii]|uniref:c-type heme family protein n=1 Tax=Desulfospira joergensenii TaxID=53329 RepID=UPI0003B5B5F0|nr:DUF3365 domain-containing protein [Desulfospira joergensenii]